MADKREEILERLRAIALAAQTGAGIVTVVRNRQLLQNEERPAMVILDGDERPAFTPNAAAADRYAGVRPVLTKMSPELYLLLDEARPTGLTAAAENVGTVLNDKRIKLCNAITNDAALKALLGSNGGIFYNGCVTDLKSGSPLTGQMRLDFSFNYLFNPTAS